MLLRILRATQPKVLLFLIAEKFRLPIVYLSYLSGVIGKSAVEDQTLFDIYQQASGGDFEFVNKTFNFGSASVHIRSKLWKTLGRFSPLYGMQGQHMSAEYTVQSLIQDKFDASLSIENFLTGVGYVHRKVLVRNVFEMYERNVSDAVNDTLLELVNEFHDLTPAQLASIHRLSDGDLSLLTNVTIRDLQNVGVSVEGTTMEVLIRLAIRIGK